MKSKFIYTKDSLILVKPVDMGRGIFMEQKTNLRVMLAIFCKILFMVKGKLYSKMETITKENMSLIRETVLAKA